MEVKGPYLSLLAFKQVAEVVPETRLIMVRDGPLLESCQQLARAWKVDHVVSFAGTLPHAQVAAVMREARALIQHSLKTSAVASEGTPVAILEAGASGLPVVSTRHGGIQEFLKFLFPSLSQKTVKVLALRKR